MNICYITVFTNLSRETFELMVTFNDETSHTAAVWLAWKLATRRPLDTKRVVNCGLTTRFDAMSSTEIFEVINKPQQLHTNYTTRS